MSTHESSCEMRLNSSAFSSSLSSSSVTTKIAFSFESIRRLIYRDGVGGVAAACIDLALPGLEREANQLLWHRSRALNVLRHTARLRHPPWDQEGIIDVEPLHSRIPREPPLLGLSRFPFSADTTILSITFFVLSYFCMRRSSGIVLVFCPLLFWIGEIENWTD